MKTFTKNPPRWDKDEILNELEEFKNLYKDRPIKENIYGMRFQHMLATYYDEVNALLEFLQRRRRRRRRLLGVWPSIKNGFTNLMNSASGFMFGKDEQDEMNRDDVMELDVGAD